VPAEPVWLSLDAVVAINREEVAKTGERHELVDRAALEIAVKRPWNVWVYFMDRDFATLAMSLLVAVAGARAFAAANEATAYRAALALLEANGLALDLDGNTRAREQLYEYFLGRLSQSGVREWFRMWMTPPIGDEGEG
jgi:prophage maintenance system killer protein